MQDDDQGLNFKQLVLKYIKKNDYFGKPITLSLNKKPSYKSVIGGLVTIFIVVFCVAVSFGYFRSLIYGEDPIFISYRTKDDYTPMFNVNNTNFFLGARLENEYGMLVPNDPRGYEIIFNYNAFIKTNKDNTLKYVYKEDISLTNKCKLENANNDATLFFSQGLGDFYCHDFSRNYVVGGDWTSNALANMRIIVKKCNIDTEKKYGVKCDKDFFKNNVYYIAVKMSNYIINPFNHYNITTRTSEYFYRMIEDNVEKTALIRLARTNISNDMGVMWTTQTKTSEIHVDDFFPDQKPGVFNYSLGNEANNLQTITFGLSTNVNNYFRNYLRVQDLISTIGGFMSIAVFVFEGIYKMYLYFEYRDFLFNSLFDFYYRPSEEEEKKYIPKMTIIVKNDEGNERVVAPSDSLNVVSQNLFYDKIMEIKQQIDMEDEIKKQKIEQRKSKFQHDEVNNESPERKDSIPIDNGGKNLSVENLVNAKETEKDKESETMRLNINNLVLSTDRVVENQLKIFENATTIEIGKANIIKEVPEGGNDGNNSFDSKISEELLDQNKIFDPRSMTKVRNRRSTNFLRGIYDFKKKQELYSRCHISADEIFQFKFCYSRVKGRENAEKTRQIIKLAELEVYKKTDLRRFIEGHEQLNLLKRIFLNKHQIYMLDNKEKLMVYDRFGDIISDNKNIEDKMHESEMKQLAELKQYLKTRKTADNLDSTDLMLFEHLKREYKAELVDLINV